MFAGTYISVALITIGVLLFIVLVRAARSPLPVAQLPARARLPESELYDALRNDVEKLIAHVADPTLPANIAVLYAAHAATSLDATHGIPILVDGSCTMSPFEFDDVYPLLFTLETHFRGTQPLALLQRATSTWPIGRGFRVKTYRPSLIAWVTSSDSRACLSMVGSDPFMWTIDGSEYGLKNAGSATMLFALEVHGLGIWYARSDTAALMVTVRHEQPVNMIVDYSPDTTLLALTQSAASERLFVGDDVGCPARFRYGDGEPRLIDESPILFRDDRMKISVIDNVLFVTVDDIIVIGQVNLIDENGKTQDGSWEQMFSARLLPSGEHILYGNMFV